MQLDLPLCDDLHLHLRDNEMLKLVAPATARWARRAIIMPNLSTPLNNVKNISDYKQRILQATDGTGFEPLMTWYLGENDDIDAIISAYQAGIITAVKWYPVGATTNSQSGIRFWKNAQHIFKAMAEMQIPVLVHGESVDPKIDFFDREAAFIEDEFFPLLETIPDIKIVLEHVSTRQACAAVLSAGNNVAATITAHHASLDRNIIFKTGLMADYFCLPVLKRAEDKEVILDIMASGHPRFFAGTDSAPHPHTDKYAAKAKGGIFSAVYAPLIYAQIFDDIGTLHHLENFLCKNGADFYGLPYNQERFSIYKSDKKLDIAPWLKTDGLKVRNFDPMMNIFWHYAEYNLALN